MLDCETPCGAILPIIFTEYFHPRNEAHSCSQVLPPIGVPMNVALKSTAKISSHFIIIITSALMIARQSFNKIN